jgi:hypothetical protein
MSQAPVYFFATMTPQEFAFQEFENKSKIVVGGRDYLMNKG